MMNDDDVNEEQIIRVSSFDWRTNFSAFVFSGVTTST